MITKTRIMANRGYSISSSSCEEVANNTSFSILSSATTSISDTTLCNCQQRAASSNTNNCSSTSSSRRRSCSSTMMPINSPVFLIMSLLFFISYFTCCVSAWPILNHRRTYAPPSVALADYNDLVDLNQWAMAAQPADNYYDTLPVLPQQIQQETYDDEQFYDQQEPEEETYQMPAYFGPVMDPVEPEEELELEQLKQQQPYMYEKRRPAKVTATLKPATLPSSSTSSHSAATPAPSASPSSTASSSHPSSNSSKSKVAAGQQPHIAVVPLQKNSISPGQKEIAMLRPPSSAKSHYIQLDEPEEPKISVAQRSPSNEKPSAYDRLRQYLSLDDALKKEYQQRRASAMSRHHAKRESISSIITDSDSLTGQLNNLKKKID